MSSHTAGAPAPSPSPAVPKTASAPSAAPAPTPSSTGTTTTKKKSTKKKAAGDGSTKTKKPARRKKPAAKTSGTAASNAAILQTAKTATGDLAHSRAHTAARRTDPLWYRIEDVLPPPSKATAPDLRFTMAPSSSTLLPEQVQIVEAALAHNNMTRADVTPQAMACLLEQARRYAQELLDDAQDYAAHAGGMLGPPLVRAPAAGAAAPVGPLPEPSPRDILLAAELRPDHPQAVTSQLPKLNLLAQQVNATPLPPIPPQCYSGVLLPPPPHALTARTFDVVSGAHVAQKMIHAAPAPTKAFANSMSGADSNFSSSKKSSKSSSKTGYGASRGAQIPVQLKKAESAEQTKPPAATSSSTPAAGTNMPEKKES